MSIEKTKKQFSKMMENVSAPENKVVGKGKNKLKKKRKKYIVPEREEKFYEVLPVYNDNKPSINSLIYEFKQEFNRADYNGKIEVLRKYATKVLFKPDDKYINTTRYLFSKMPRWISKDKCICGKRAEIRHHIILVKNGGNNKYKNIIHLCRDCHCKIHYWIVPDAIMAEIVRMEREFYNITK